MNRNSLYHRQHSNFGDDRDRRRSGLFGQDRSRGSVRHPVKQLTRAKTLTRPDRFVAPAPLISPEDENVQHNVSWFQPWTFFSRVVTFWAPGPIMAACGIKDSASQQAWREKVALCLLAALLSGIVAFITVGLNLVLCPQDGGNNPQEFLRLGQDSGFVGIKGWMFNISESVTTNNVDLYSIASKQSGQDVSSYFDQSAVNFPSCSGHASERYASSNLCANSTSSACLLGTLDSATFSSLKITNSTKRVGYDWSQLTNLTDYFVIDGNVLNLGSYLAANPNPLTDDETDEAIRYAVEKLIPSGGKDVTKLFYSRTANRDAMKCIIERYKAGHIDKITPGCFASQLFLYCSLIVIMGLVLARFFMAILFSWFLSHKLVRPIRRDDLKRLTVSPAVMPPGANLTAESRAGTAPWTGAKLQKSRKPNNEKMMDISTSRNALPTDHNGLISMESIGSELFCACLVTCYSEGLEGIRTTLDSISSSTYSDARKLIFVICDGMITGDGESVSTPDICVGLIEPDPRFGNPQPMSYLAIGAGKKQHNQAMIYAGHYTRIDGHRTPIIVIVKCGTPAEANEKKPGNRGKRDSQILLMNFFSCVTYNSDMTPLDFDMFRKVQALMGVTPDFFEVCLMVDADTKIYPDSMNHLVNAFQHDPLIMGVCGETRIANKRQSWVTAIQVHEYFISHHLSKAFESVFGGVTCLPGCFSMYRLKARKQNESDWIPVLTQSGVVNQYSQSTVTTLHQKNLLLLGEDRFLTTLLLRTFPNRKMVFVPQARCRTIAPDTFKVLLSQRRRWINSTIHNLMELVRVPDLCGTFCFSMQFVVFMDLIGTVVLPVAICLTYSLIVTYILNPPSSFADAIPLMLLGSVLGLPAVLIVITTRKVIYVCWMLVYLLALPVWNLILPVYAFWCFDDFSWGETRKVQGAGKDTGHGGEENEVFDAKIVPRRLWADWERSRIRKHKREAKRRQHLEQTFGNAGYHNDNERGGLSRYPTNSQYLSLNDEISSVGHDTSETASIANSEEDRWGLQIGYYADAVPDLIHHPVGLYPANQPEMYRHSRLELELNEGWKEDKVSTPGATYNFRGDNDRLGTNRNYIASSYYSSVGDRSTYMLSERDPTEPPPLPLDTDIVSPRWTAEHGNSYFNDQHNSNQEESPEGSEPSSRVHAKSSSVEARHAKKRSGGGHQYF